MLIIGCDFHTRSQQIAMAMAETYDAASNRTGFIDPENGSTSYTYDSFGKLTASTGSLVNPFRYTSRESDPETGLYYYRARYYDATTGRFLVEDPLGFDAGNNFYAYAANSPLNYLDPFGTCIIEMWVVHTGENNDGTLYHSFLTFYDNSGSMLPHQR